MSKMTNLDNLLAHLIKLPTETEWLEFKENNANPEEIGKIISALANGASLHEKDCGFLVFGVDDKTHTVVGTSFKPRQAKIGNEELENWLLRKLDPRVNLKIQEFKYIGKWHVVILEIPAAIDRPVRFDGTAYMRVGSYTKPLNDFPEKERKIWNNHRLLSFEKEIALRDVTSDEVLELIDYPVYFSSTQQKLPTSKDSIIERLEGDSLIKKVSGKYNITNLGALLFAKDLKKFPGLRRDAIRIIQYVGNNRVKTVKEHEIIAGYAVSFEKVVEYITDKLPSNEEIKKAIRKEIKMYPEIAIRELVANAIVHQDFLERGNGPMIEIFEDRLEVVNRGIPLISTERFIDSSPRARNEELAKFMRRIGFCEQRGSGIDKVVEAAEVFQLPAPKFESSNGSTHSTLYAHRPIKKMDKDDKMRACYQHCVLRHVSNDYMTNSSLRKRFDIKDTNYPIASRIINDTLNEKLIRLFDGSPKHSRKYAKYLPFWA